MIDLIIDDNKVSVPSDTTILDAARSVGIHIPALCAYKGLTPIGSCRVCVVEVEGNRKPVASCNIPVSNGMVVRTNTPRIMELRRMVVELILATHPLDCPTCDKGGECDLQDITYALGIKEPKFKLNNPVRTKTGTNPFLYIDFQKCIQCIRCARYTEEVEGAKGFDYHGSGGYSREMDRHPDSGNEGSFTGGVTAVCPVGALLNRPFKVHSARPWELKVVKTTCPHCEAACKILLNTKSNEIFRITSPSETDFSEGHPCLRGRFGYGFISHPSILSAPLVRSNGELKEASWDEALHAVSSGLLKVRDKYGPDAIAGLPSISLTNEEHAAFSLFLSRMGGRTALPEGMGESSMKGVLYVLGEGYARPDSILDESDLIVVIGADIGGINPLLASKIGMTARLNQSRTIIISPRMTGLCSIAWRRFAPLPGTEAALVTWLGKRVAEIRGGLSEWMKRIDETQLRELTGVASSDVNEAAQAIAASARPCIIVGDDISYDSCYQTGVSAANLLILAGKSGSETAGLFCALPEANSRFGLSVHKGAMDARGLYREIGEGKIRALVIAGEDPAADWPVGWVEALKSLELLVVLDNSRTETAGLAHVVLPSLSFAENQGGYTGPDGRVSSLGRGLVPRKGARSCVEVISEIGRKMMNGFNEEDIQSVVMNLRAKGTPVKETGTVPVSISSGIRADGEYPFILLTGRSLYGSKALFQRCEPLNEAFPEALLEMSPDDGSRLDIRTGDIVTVTSKAGKVETKVSVTRKVMPGTVYLPVHILNGSRRLSSPQGGPCLVKISK